MYIVFWWVLDHKFINRTKQVKGTILGLRYLTSEWRTQDSMSQYLPPQFTYTVPQRYATPRGALEHIQ